VLTAILLSPSRPVHHMPDQCDWSGVCGQSQQLSVCV